MPNTTRLSLGPDEPSPSRGGGNGLVVLLFALLLVAVAGLGLVSYRVHDRMDAVERQLASVSRKADDMAAFARQAMDRAAAAEAAVKVAAERRQQAEAQATGALQQADSARRDADTARETASRAQAEAERIRKRAEADIGRLETALGEIAETRRTALGLVMNLGSDHLKFAFDKAELRPEDRELLSRIAGILVTAPEYSISVNGHTDDVGSAEYNQKLSERRAQAVRDYLVKAGLPAQMLSVAGHGKSLPLVKGSSEAARARNRRVELGIVNTQIRYGVGGTSGTGGGTLE